MKKYRNPVTFYQVPVCIYFFNGKTNFAPQLQYLCFILTERNVTLLRNEYIEDIGPQLWHTWEYNMYNTYNRGFLGLLQPPNGTLGTRIIGGGGCNFRSFVEDPLQRGSIKLSRIRLALIHIDAMPFLFTLYTSQFAAIVEDPLQRGSTKLSRIRLALIHIDAKPFLLTSYTSLPLLRIRFRIRSPDPHYFS